MNSPTHSPRNTQDTPQTGSQRPASGWRNFALCYGAGLALLLVTTGALKLAFAALG